MPKAALFDVDGTLVDSNDLHAEAWGEIFRRFGVDIPHAVIRQQIGKGGDNLMPALLPPRLIAAHGPEIEAQRRSLYRDRYLPRVRPFPGVRALFEALRRDDIRIMLASSAAEQQVRQHCAMLDIADLIEGTVSGDDVAHSKPCPDLFAAALNRLGGIDPQDVVVIGDSPYDMEAASKLGIPAMGLLCGGFDAGLLRWSGAAALFEGPWTLPARIDDWLPAEVAKPCPAPAPIS
ncbi:putative hydrolase [Sphingomonas changbaiensis NBRC 104936]|uniref:Putative hydrolase n=1 Tax=Sphingomonas changbaiensis NBRC 104936 TaxID=1219043 RepID=A0A0E9MKK4_9SPHN|nr:HAD family hydrolase [Sphingomonas changbaiensis]GAO38038.1 putative hydrolase [Sphingomonas changbaiensis NBRC 104936]